MPLLIATGNAGKRREFEVLLGDLLRPSTEVFDNRSWPEELPDVVEDRDTFYGNAIKKAFETSVETDVTTLADDSGLEVDALDGRPGVYSARYAGPEATDQDNNQKLVDELSGVSFEQRTARYVAVLCLCLAKDDLGQYLMGRLVPDGEQADARDGDWQSSREGVPFQQGGRTLVWFRATCEGHIIDDPRGDGGFGYDPYFFVKDWGKTMGEVTLDKKNERSHRAAAVRKLLEFFGA